MAIGRRTFIALGGSAGLLGAAGCTLGGPQHGTATRARRDLERRVASLIEEYDRQGDHRTGTTADTESGDWLAGQARQASGDAALESFELSRVEPRACHVSIEGRRIDGLPLFDTRFSDRNGVRGRLGPLGSDAEIGLTESEPSRLTDPGSESRRAVLSEIRQSRHQAVILLTRGTRPGLFVLNAPLFERPLGPPTLQVSSAESALLHRHAAARAEVDVTIHAERVPARAANVVARIRGANPVLPPIVVSTPRSGWWRCASERGGGLACWLEVMRRVAAAKASRECVFVAFSGHEIGWLGMHDFLRRRPEAIRGAYHWLHFGANIGAPGQPNMINAADDSLEQWAADAMERAGLTVGRRAARGSTPFGEAAFVHRGGGRYVAIVCDSDHFHHPDDRWPAAVDVGAVARYAEAFADGVARLAHS